MFWPTAAAAHQVCRPNLCTFCKKKLNSSCSLTALPAQPGTRRTQSAICWADLAAYAVLRWVTGGTVGTGCGHRSAAPFLLSAMGWADHVPLCCAQCRVEAQGKETGRSPVVVTATSSVPEKHRLGREYLVVVPILYSFVGAQDLMCRCCMVSRPGRASDNKPERENSIILLE